MLTAWVVTAKIDRVSIVRYTVLAAGVRCWRRDLPDAATDIAVHLLKLNGDVGKCGFVGEIHVAPQTAGGTSGTLSFSTDSKQSCMYVADLANDTVYEINRETLQELDRFGTGGRQLDQFHWPHVVSVDSEGHVYTGEVDSAGRVQKFFRHGPIGCSGTGSKPIGVY